MEDYSMAGRRGGLIVRMVTAVAPLIWQAAVAQQPPARELFQPGERCLACHSGMATSTGDTMSIGTDWRASMMGNAARDPYWHAGVRREVLDHPGAREAIEDKCATCHMPMARYERKTAGHKESVFEHLSAAPAVMRSDRLALDGVSCTTCHQIQLEGLGHSGVFQIDTTRAWGDRRVFGSFVIDSGRARIMRSAAEFRPEQSRHMRQSEFCASCHTLYTHALGPEGQALGELPEQVPYLEWLHSEFVSTRSCQSCHMPSLDSVAIASVWGESRSGVPRHAFEGGNAFMLRLLRRYHAELRVAALPAELDSAVRHTEEHLRSRAARLTIERAAREAGRVTVALALENLAGHKLPSAYPSRRVWVHVTMRDAGGKTLFESGALGPGGRIAGNDNDADPLRFEPHYRAISRGDEVQIYEAVMVDHRGAVTTGLLSGVRYVKDNRLLPRGFDPAAAAPDVAVHGEATADADFTGGGDRISYVVEATAAGPITVTAELWYQTIGYRWAENLRAYDAPETRRFVSYYDTMADASGIVLARAETTIR
jgi:hypothetical protein